MVGENVSSCLVEYNMKRLTRTEDRYRNKIRLTGILYLHRITDNRMGGTPLRNLRMFGELCGYSALKQVVLVTTMWDKIQDAAAGEVRETELKTTFWQIMLEKGSRVAKFNNNFDSAHGIVNGLITERSAETLLLQEELVDLKRRLNETHAGQLLYSDLQRLLEEQRGSIDQLMAQIEEKAGSFSPNILESLRREQKKIEEELQKTLEGVQQLKIPLSRRILRFLFGKKGKNVSFP